MTLILPCSVQGRDTEGATVVWERMDGVPLAAKNNITSVSGSEVGGAKWVGPSEWGQVSRGMF